MPATHLAILVLVLVYFLVWKMVSYPPNNFSLSLQRPGRSLPPSWAVQHDSAKPFDAPAQEVPVTAFPPPPIACSYSFSCVHSVHKMHGLAL